MNEKADYRNGKYEGQMNVQKQRHGLGIFIDDDLTFYVSHWAQNKINGLSLIYISHGKYIYGEWKNNEPHGLTVFRSGDTVLVGKCKNGKPINKCLVIFQRFNFACILQQASQSWNIIQSGQLVNYDTLVSYIELIEVPVPDYFFSLTKFVCHFSKNSHHIKTFPCLMNCCYFGYNNGLAIIFNTSNGLISIGSHEDEELSQFGGRFDGIRSVEEGNFESGGQTLKYSGDRPVNKIYGIFQKIHKKSLNFLNEYFDSKIKYFTCIEQLLKNKLAQITNQCRKNKSLRNIDLNDSLQYQQYTEEQSIKLNSIRQNMYQVHIQNIETPPHKFTPKSPLNKAALKEIEEKELKCQKYFRKASQNKFKKQPRQTTQIRQIRQQKQKVPFAVHGRQQPKSNIVKSKEQVQPYQLKGYSVIKKSPAAKFDLQKSKKSQLSSNSNNQYIKTKQVKYLQESCVPQQLTPSKLKDRMKNNLCYINPSPQPIQQQKKDKNQFVIKSNNIYKEIKTTKFNEEQIFAFNEKSEEIQNYKVPNFNYANQQSKQEDKKKSSFFNLVQKDSSQSKNQNNFNRNTQKPQKLLSAFQKNKLNPSKIQNRAQNNQLQQVKSKRQLGLSPSRKSIDTSSMSKPSYEDIQQRRKRILKEFKDLNEPNLPHSPKKSPKKLDSPCQNLVFSLPKQQQSSFGYMPITVSDKYNKPSTATKRQQVNQQKKIHQTSTKKQNYVLAQRENYGQKNILLSAEDRKPHQQKNSAYQSKPQRSNQSYKFNNYVNENHNKGKSTFDQQGSTPQRVKKNYQYIYE